MVILPVSSLQDTVQDIREGESAWLTCSPRLKHNSGRPSNEHGRGRNQGSMQMICGSHNQCLADVHAHSLPVLPARRIVKQAPCHYPLLPARRSEA